VDCTITGEKGPTPGTIAAIMQAAERYGIPAELAGIPMKNGKPPDPDLYKDPGGQAGLRYWDGTQWSPLLPPDLRKPRSVTARESVGAWSALPMAEGPWTYAAARAKYWTAWLASLGAVSVVLLSVGLLTELWWDRGAHPRHWSGSVWFVLGAVVALHALHPWRARRWFLKLDKAANDSGDTAMTGAAR
jgi:Protein of unknown function (DUF2510)